jgi:hypothetical protein
MQDRKIREVYSCADNLLNKHCIIPIRLSSLDVLASKTIKLNNNIKIGTAVLLHSFVLQNLIKWKTLIFFSTVCLKFKHKEQIKLHTLAILYWCSSKIYLHLLLVSIIIGSVVSSWRWSYNDENMHGIDFGNAQIKIKVFILLVCSFCWINVYVFAFSMSLRRVAGVR